MSTRCNIIIKDRNNNRIVLYHHHDGYPEGVGVQLKKVLSKYEDWQLKQHGYYYIPNELLKNKCSLNDNGYELGGNKIHGDIEYLYVINCKTRALTCYRVGWDDHENFDINFSKVISRSHIVDIPEWDGGKTMYE